jgi:hypothetical protein
MSLEAWSNPRPSRKNKFRLSQSGKILNFKNILGGKFFGFCRPNFSKRLGCSRRHQSFNAPIPVVDILPRVSLGMVVRTACQVSVIMTDQVSRLKAFFRFSRHVSSTVSSFFDYRRLDFSTRLIKPRLGHFLVRFSFCIIPLRFLELSTP